MTQQRATPIPPRERYILLAGGAAWIMLTGVLDYLSGIEYRIFPLYFLPILLVGWRMGYPSTIGAAWLSAASWMVANYLGGLKFSDPVIWVVNTLTQGVSFSMVGGLMVLSRRAFQLADTRSRTDDLTGLLNTRAFSQEAPRMIALCNRHGRPVTVAYLDLDHFKQVNDRLGHARGDEILAMVAAAFRDVARDTDIVARLGGDEFAFLLPETDEAGARIVLERACGRIRQLFQAEPVPVTASIGAVTGQPGPRAIDALLRLADANLYDAKAKGKDRVTLTVLDG